MEDSESLFGFEELFFSTTNEKGIIATGNSVFKRVSEFDWNELEGKPHNIIRHPDMPRGVFYLFWQMINKGLPIGAYVKNRSKTGRFYWVFALAQPIKGGFLSIRLKPSSSIFDLVRVEYQKLLELENTQKLPPQESCRKLSERIVELGYESYSEFMISALMTELESRQQRLNRAPIAILKKIAIAVEMNSRLSQGSLEMIKKFKESGMLPLNLTVQAAKLGDEGNSLAVVANQYSIMSDEIEVEFKKFIEVLKKTEKTMQECQYSICAALLQTEVLELFEQEQKNSNVDLSGESNLLKQIHEAGMRRSSNALNEIRETFNAFITTCQNIQTMSTGLEIVRLTGKIEISRIASNQESLKNILDSLHSFRQLLDSTIKDVSALGLKIQEQVTQISPDELS